MGHDIWDCKVGTFTHDKTKFSQNMYVFLHLPIVPGIFYSCLSKGKNYIL